ncbi:glycosyltransferase involved in cell wall biosynthesis [Microcella alkaliphila]|uniref:Glycosyltransferase involved in cell wall biosynthesis n=1 Tax=Microcella alkaliphila TaxID=279828 RepID=A0A4Q7TF12_9MICO|nr:glycosyltransferase involved in cell wall biosynthesis [Microcella alkaliphila]
MRILVANHANSLDHLGGAELSLLALLEDWQSLTCAPEILVVSPGPPGTFSARLGQLGIAEIFVTNGRWVLPPFEANPAGRARSAREGLSTLAVLDDIVSSFRPDAVVTNTISSPWAAIAAARAGVPHAWMVREYGDLDHGLVFTLGAESTKRLINDLSVFVIANSRAVAEHFRRPTNDGSTPLVMYPKAPHSLPEVTPPDYDGGRINILAIARVTPTKGLGILPNAVRILRDSGTDARITIVGSEVHRGYRSQLIRSAQSLQVDGQLVFKDEQSDISADITAAHVGLSPGPWEAFGRTTVEYMSMSRPAIASRNSGSAELLRPGFFGQIFDPESPTSLANAIRWYSEQPARVRSEGQRGRSALQEAGSGTLDSAGFMELIVRRLNEREPEREALARNAEKEVVSATRSISRRVPNVLEFPVSLAFRAKRRLWPSSATTWSR